MIVLNVPAGVAKGCLSAVLAYHMACVGIYALPEGPVRDRLFHWIAPHLHLFGFWQTWAMYSPDPPKAVLETEAWVFYADGAARECRFREFDRKSLLDGYFDQPFRVVFNYLASYPTIGPDLARYVSRRCDDWLSPPVRVELTWKVRSIPPPGSALASRVTRSPAGSWTVEPR